MRHAEPEPKLWIALLLENHYHAIKNAKNKLTNLSLGDVLFPPQVFANRRTEQAETVVAVSNIFFCKINCKIFAKKYNLKLPVHNNVYRAVDETEKTCGRHDGIVLQTKIPENGNNCGIKKLVRILQQYKF